VQLPVPTSDLAIEKLTEAVNKMLLQLQERRPSTLDNTSRSVCYSGTSNYHTYISIPAEDVLLFAVAKQDPQRLSEELEEAELEEETLEQLMEEEANKEEKMDNAPKIVELTLPVEFKKITHVPLGNNHPKAEEKKFEEELEDSDKEYEEE
ncbi:4999_t:CDS:2, partial [Racocetra fulgida]